MCLYGHVPLWHVSAEQEGKSGQEDESKRFPDAVLNTDNCFSGFRAPHSGHFGAGSELLRARCSNPDPHLRHKYSYIGIFFVPLQFQARVFRTEIKRSGWHNRPNNEVSLCFRRYSTRIPACAASTIFKLTCPNNLAFRRKNLKFW